MKIAPLAIALAGLAAGAATIETANGKSWQLPFWIDGEVEGVTDDDVLTHPCGAMVELSVSAIPLDRRNIDTDKVVEFDASGEVVREWRTPVDYPPIAVEGERLIVSILSENEPVFLALHPSGQIDDFATQLTLPEGAELRCPAAVISHFGGSDYLRCERWTDRTSGAVRLVAFEGPCT